MEARSAGSRRGYLRTRPDLATNGIQVFSATMRIQREQLGEAVTAWMRAHPEITVVDMTVVQSSDAEFHCVTIVVGYRIRARRGERTWRPHTAARPRRARRA